jgi:hypothetical protein
VFRRACIGYPGSWWRLTANRLKVVWRGRIANHEPAE